MISKEMVLTVGLCFAVTGTVPMPASFRGDGLLSDIAGKNAAAGQRTGKFVSLHLGSVDTASVEEAARHVDMMIFSPNVTVSVPETVRTINPDVRCLGYINSLDFNGKGNGDYLSTPGMKADWPIINTHEDWFLHDENGERILVYLHTGARERYAIDRTHPGLQRYLAEKGKEIITAGYDGVFLDNFSLELLFRREDKYSGFPAGMTNTAWQEGGYELLSAMKEELTSEKLLVFNGVHGGSSHVRSSFQTEGLAPFDSAMRAADVCDGGMWEGYFGWGELNLSESRLSSTVNTLAAFNTRNKVTIACATGESDRDAKTLFCLYLLSLDGENAYFSYVPNYKRIRWYPVFDTDIGRPVAEYELHDGIATRRYENGFVSVNAKSQEVTIDLPGVFQNPLGENVEKLTLQPKSGEILFEESAKIELEKPSGIELHGNYPNPFNTSTTIAFTLPAPGFIHVDIYSVSGQKVRELLTGTVTNGNHTVVWDGRDISDRQVSSGVFISRLTVNDYSETHRMMLVR